MVSATSLIANAVTYVQMIATYNLISVPWPAGLGEMVRGLAPINLDVTWLRTYTSVVDRIPLRFKFALLLSIAPFMAAIAYALVLWVLITPHIPTLLLSCYTFAGLVWVAAGTSSIAGACAAGCVALGALSNPFFMCFFAKPTSVFGKLMRSIQDAMPPLVCILSSVAAYHAPVKARGFAIAGACIAGFASISVALQLFTAAGRKDRGNMFCRLATLAGRQSLSMVLAVYSMSIIPLLSLSIESINFIEYSCPEFTVFNPLASRPEDDLYTTSPDVFCDPCEIASWCSLGNSTAARQKLCPAVTLRRLATDPQTSEPDTFLFSGLVVAYLCLMVVLSGLFFMAMVRSVRLLRKEIQPGGNLDACLKQNPPSDNEESGHDDDDKSGSDQPLKKKSADKSASGIMTADTLVMNSEGERALDDKLWDRCCELFGASKALGLCGDYRYAMRYSFFLFLLHKIAVVAATVPVAPRSHLGSAIAVTCVHAVMFIITVATRPFRSAFEFRLNLAELFNELYVGVVAIAAIVHGSVPDAVGYVSLALCVALPVISTVHGLKEKCSKKKEKRKAQNGDDEHGTAEPLITIDSSPVARQEERGGEISNDPSPLQQMPQPHHQPHHQFPPHGQQHHHQHHHHHMPPPAAWQGYGAPPQPVPHHHHYYAQPPHPSSFQPASYAYGYSASNGAPPMGMIPPPTDVAPEKPSNETKKEKTPEEAAVEHIDSNVTSRVVLPAIIAAAGCIGYAIYVSNLGLLSNQSHLGVATLKDGGEYISAYPPEAVQEWEKFVRMVGGNTSTAFATATHVACCTPGKVTNTSEFPDIERWLWFDGTENRTRRVLTHVRTTEDDSGLPIRSLCGNAINPACRFLSHVDGFALHCDPNALNVSDFAVDDLW